MQATGMHFEVFDGTPAEAKEKANAYLAGHDMTSEPVIGTVTNFHSVDGELRMTILLTIAVVGTPSPIAIAKMRANGVN